MTEPVDFAVTVRYADDAPTLIVEGDVDTATASQLAAIVHAVTDRGPRAVVLDLRGVEFLGAAGLGIIAVAAAQLARVGGRLTLRSPSGMV